MKRGTLLILLASIIVAASCADELYFPNVKSAYVQNDRMYVLHSTPDGNLKVLSILDLKKCPDMKLLGRYVFKTNPIISDLIVHDHYAFFPRPWDIRILDVANPGAISDLGTFTIGDGQDTVICGSPYGHTMISTGGQLLALMHLETHHYSSFGDTLVQAYFGVSELGFDGKALTNKRILTSYPNIQAGFSHMALYSVDAEGFTVFIDTVFDDDPHTNYLWTYRKNKKGAFDLFNTVNYKRAAPMAWIRNGKNLYTVYPNGIHIYDTTSRSKAKKIPNMFNWGYYDRPSVFQDTLYLAQGSSMKLIDLHDPLNPGEIGTISDFVCDIELITYGCYGIAFAGGKLRLYSLESGNMPVQLFSPRELLEAVRKKDYQEMQRQIDHGILPSEWVQVGNGEDGSAEPVFFSALRDDDPVLLKYLLSHCIDEMKVSLGEVRLFSVAADMGSIKCLPVVDSFSHTSINSSGYPYRNNPIQIAAGKNNLELVKKLLELGADINAKSSEGFGPGNALTAARTPEMKQFLISRGIKTVESFQTPLNATASEDGIRVRKSADLKSEVVGRVAKDEKVFILAMTYERTEVDGRTAPWLNIRKTDGTTGWSYGGYFYIPAFEGE